MEQFCGLLSHPSRLFRECTLATPTFVGHKRPGMEWCRSHCGSPNRSFKSGSVRLRIWSINFSTCNILYHSYAQEKCIISFQGPWALQKYSALLRKEELEGEKFRKHVEKNFGFPFPVIRPTGYYRCSQEGIFDEKRGKLQVIMQSTSAEEFHEGMKATIHYENETLSKFSIDTGMKQDCDLALTGFDIFSILLKYTFGNDGSSILIKSRMDGSVFNIRQFQSRRHVTQATIQDLLFTGDAAFVSNSPDEQ
ncbi:unnamed protein product [Caretta caretta]